MGIDKRVIRTRTSIKMAFMQLVQDRDFVGISISDVTAVANINRSTFYLHYTSLEAVMEDIENEIANAATDCIEGFDISNLYISFYNLLHNLSDRISTKPVWKDFIISSTVASQVQHKIKNIFIDKAMIAYIKDYPLSNPEFALLYITYTVGGIFDTYVKWATTEDTSLTLDELILKLCNSSEQVLGKLLVE